MSGRAVGPAVGGLVLVLVLAPVLAGRQHPQPEPPLADYPSPGPVLRAVAIGHNQPLAEQAVEQTFTAAPLPPGAEPRDHSPAPELEDLRDNLRSHDPSLHRWTWWVVPSSVTSVIDWYDAHTPAHANHGYERYHLPFSHLWWMAGSDDAAHTQVYVEFSYTALGPSETALRLDVNAGARFDRTASTFVPLDSVTSAQITSDTDAGSPRTVTDPTRLRALARAFDAVPGVVMRRVRGMCGWGRGIHRYAVTFAWPGHELVVGSGDPQCGVPRTLTLDGRVLRPRLEIDDAFNSLLGSTLAS